MALMLAIGYLKNPTNGTVPIEVPDCVARLCSSETFFQLRHAMYYSYVMSDCEQAELVCFAREFSLDWDIDPAMKKLLARWILTNFDLDMLPALVMAQVDYTRDIICISGSENEMIYQFGTIPPTTSDSVRTLLYALSSTAAARKQVEIYCKWDKSKQEQCVKEAYFHLPEETAPNALITFLRSLPGQRTTASLTDVFLTRYRKAIFIAELNTSTLVDVRNYSRHCEYTKGSLDCRKAQKLTALYNKFGWTINEICEKWALIVSSVEYAFEQSVLPVEKTNLGIAIASNNISKVKVVKEREKSMATCWYRENETARRSNFVAKTNRYKEDREETKKRCRAKYQMTSLDTKAIVARGKRRRFLRQTYASNAKPSTKTYTPSTKHYINAYAQSDDNIEEELQDVDDDDLDAMLDML